MAWSEWVDLELDDEEIAEEQARMATPIPPKYPYGMRICFDGTLLEKLRLPLPKIDDVIDIRAFAKVTGVPDRNRVELQITQVKVENEDTEDEED